MELIYLWVEKYKNIKEQGFNFSPRFECKFDKNTKKLTINEKLWVDRVALRLQFVIFFTKNCRI